MPTVMLPEFPNVNVEEDVVLYLSPSSPDVPAVPEEPDVPAVPIYVPRVPSPLIY